MKELELKTPTQRAVEERQKAVCDLYTYNLKKHEGVAPTRLFEAIAKETGLTSMGVRHILIQNNLYTPKNNGD